MILKFSTQIKLGYRDKRIKLPDERRINPEVVCIRHKQFKILQIVV